MDALMLAGLLVWAMCFIALGTGMMWRSGSAPKAVGLLLVVVGIVPSMLVVWSLS